MYKFWYITEDNSYYEELNLTKRQAVIRYNKARRNLINLNSCGWELIED